MIPSSSPGAVVTDGAVGRAIFQSGDWKKMQKGAGNTPVSIFLDKKSPLAISVFLLDLTSDAELTKIGDNMASQRAGKRTFYGWAELSVADASKDGRRVHATPQPENKWHADIVLPSTAETDKQERERHAQQLAKMAVPRESSPN